MKFLSFNPVWCLVFSCLAFSSFGQKKSLAGLITDKVNQQPIPRASIRNVFDGTTVLSKADGNFITDVSAGNILAFSANGYYTDTITITNNVISLGNLFIQLKPLPSTLGNVTITGNIIPYQYDSLERRKAFLETVGENKINAVGPTTDLGFGIALNLDHFSKSQKHKRKARSLFEIIEEEAYINYRWNEPIVEKYTNFKNEALSDFIQNARPGYEWLRKNQKEEDLVYYINSRLKKMKKG